MSHYLDYYDKLLSFEEDKYLIFNLIKNKPMSVPQLKELVDLPKQNIQNIARWFADFGHFKFEYGINEQTNCKVKIYSFSGYEYQKKTREDIIKNCSQYNFSKATDANTLAETSLKPTLPFARVVRNLNRPGSDYAWQRKKHKHTSVSIGSSFSLMETS